MTQQQLIKQIETKITETKQLITNYKNQLVSQENTLLTLIEELTQIKQQVNKKNIKNKPWK